MSGVVGNYIFLPSTEGQQQREIVEHVDGDEYLLVHNDRTQIASVPEGAEIVPPLDIIDESILEVCEPDVDDTNIAQDDNQEIEFIEMPDYMRIEWNGDMAQAPLP